MICCLAGLAIGLSAAGAGAGVEWRTIKAPVLDAVPLDTAYAFTNEGPIAFVLTDKGEVLIFSPDGNLRDKIQLDEPADTLSVAPRGDYLLVSKGGVKSVRFISLEYIRQINTADSPVKGPKEAPITIAVFSDFQ